ncbi:hypothetical protein V1477_000950 [Vespula maculifrons]|uniref:Uncharacterized protein n=3 Tax=Vespula TaxID=7451 RepID=A0A834JBA1_VESGE|nr:hypothetical protein HZH68_013853 [Vespula germanica]
MPTRRVVEKEDEEEEEISASRTLQERSLALRITLYHVQRPDCRKAQPKAAALLCAGFIQIRARDRVVCKTSNFQGSLEGPFADARGVAKTCRSVGVSTSLAINLNNK